MHILITGRPGTGKSAVANELLEQGYHAVDLEEVRGAVRLEHKTTGQPADWPKGYIDWSMYSWNVQKDVLLEVFEQTSEDIFVAISANNLPDLYDLFDIKFVLTIADPIELQRRLESRTEREFNQDPANIARAVDRYAAKTAEIIASGCTPIDNSQPLTDVVQIIINKTYDNR